LLSVTVGIVILAVGQNIDSFPIQKTNDYENFEKGMIYMKILKKGG
jgi:hypothetical protein